MTDPTRLRYLRIALVAYGLVFLFGVTPLTLFWPSGWAWTPDQHEYLQMIIVIYAVLGAFLLLAARRPLEYLSLIWFTVWSSLAHAGIMTYHAVVDVSERGHFLGDIPGLFLVAIVLGALTPRKTS